jgi:hypothetical protein
VSRLLNAGRGLLRGNSFGERRLPFCDQFLPLGDVERGVYQVVGAVPNL